MDKMFHNYYSTRNFMFKIYSKGCEHALRVLTSIPIKQYNQNFLVQSLCRKSKVPESSARKSLQILVKNNILDAVTGPGGGYRFKRHPDDITLLSIVKAIDGPDVFEKCIMGMPQCSKDKPCPVHNTWVKVRKNMIMEMEQKTLAQLMKTVRR